SLQTPSIAFLRITLGLMVVFAVGCNSSGSDDGSEKKLKLAYVTNGVASFWVIGGEGAKAGGEEFNADVEVLMPPGGITDQTAMVEDLVTKGIDGIAISPIDPDNQVDLLNTAAQRTILITQDSDAPKSDRLCYVGMDNYIAGRMCGELVLEAIPQGGKVAIFVGRMDQDNARRRRQGVIDAVLGRDIDPTRFDDPGAKPSNEKYEILGTYTDKFNFEVAKAKAEDVLSAHPDVSAMVGLFAYNPPLILEALEGAEKLGQVKVIGFDEQDETLIGIQNGHIHGTVVQNPYEYGRQSMRLLAGLARGETLESLDVPDSKLIYIPATQVRQDNVDEFWSELKATLAGDGSGQE
ncbi:MAG: substrate-binding domain-containing protein, partial [Planctomycetota bacterium]